MTDTELAALPGCTCTGGVGYERHYTYCAIVRAGFSEYIHVELTRAHDLAVAAASRGEAADLAVTVREWLTRLRREQAVTLSPTIQLYVRELERVLGQR